MNLPIKKHIIRVTNVHFCEKTIALISDEINLTQLVHTKSDFLFKIVCICWKLELELFWGEIIFSHLKK